MMVRKLMEYGVHVVAIFLALLLCSGVVAGVRDDEMATLGTVLRGFETREQRLESLTAIATIRTFYTDWHWRCIAEAFASALGEPPSRALSKEQPHKDMAVVAFCSDRNMWRIEVQSLCPGANPWFTPKDVDQATDELARFYVVEGCDGENVFRLSRGGKYPRVAIVARRDQGAPFFRGPLGECLGLAYADGAFSKQFRVAIKEAGYKLGTMEWIDEDVVYVELGAQKGQVIHELRFWVDTAAGFALRRFERFNILLDEPQSGSRDILVWSNLAPAQRAGLWLPGSCRHERFDYSPDCESPHAYTKLAEVAVLAVNEQIDLQTAAWMPAGALIHIDQSVGDPGLADLQQQSMRLWAKAERFATEGIPQPDASASQPIGPRDLQTLRKKYGL